MTTRSRLMTVFILGGLVIGGLIAAPYFPAERSVVTVCLPKAPASALPALAQELGFFQSEGLDVRTKLTDNCRICVAELADNKIDFAVSSLYSAVEAISGGKGISIITELQSSIENTSIVYRKSFGAEASAKHAWKSLALAKNSNAETLLRLFFKAHQLSPVDLKLVPVAKMTDMPDLLLRNKVDAAVLAEPVLSQVLLENNGLFLTSRSSFYTEFSVLSSRPEPMGQKSDDLDRFIRALGKAQRYYQDHPEKAHQLIVSHLQLDPGKVDPTSWSKLRMSLGLSSVLKLMIDQESINFLQHGDQNLAETSAVNISSALNPQALRKMSPDLVTFE